MDKQGGANGRATKMAPSEAKVGIAPECAQIES